MRCLGAILAGGRSRRFGSDKAHALVGEERLIDHVANALRQQCEAVVVCGRVEPGFRSLADVPAPEMGPLAGFNAALGHARENSFDAVLSCGCDVPNLPADLVRQLGAAVPAFVEDQPVVGLWPADLAGTCDAFLRSGGRSVYRFAEQVGARPVVIDPALININRPTDLPNQ